MKISKLGHVLQKNRHKLTKDVVYGVNKALGASETELSEIAKTTEQEFLDQAKKVRILLGESGKPLNAIENIPIKNEVTEAVSAPTKVDNTISFNKFFKQAKAGLNIEDKAGATNSELRPIFREFYDSGITDAEKAIAKYNETKVAINAAVDAASNGTEKVVSIKPIGKKTANSGERAARQTIESVEEQSPIVEIPKTNNTNNARKYKESYARLGVDNSPLLQEEYRPQIHAYLQQNPEASVDDIVNEVFPKLDPTFNMQPMTNAITVAGSNGSGTVPSIGSIPLVMSGGSGTTPFITGMNFGGLPNELELAKHSTVMDKLAQQATDEANEKFAYGAKVALGAITTFGVLSAALSSSRGQQNNAQLYGQQPIY